MVSSKFAIQRVFTVRLFDLDTGACTGLLEDLKQSNFSHDGVIVYSQGEIKNTL